MSGPAMVTGLRSMTGFAARSGAAHGFAWNWDIRSVNGKGLDLRLRVPDWITGLEHGLRKRLQANLARGNVALNLRISPENADAGEGIDAEKLAQALSQIAQITNAAETAQVDIAPTRASDLLALCRSSQGDRRTEDTTAISESLNNDFKYLFDDFNAMRAGEGDALKSVLQAQLDETAALVEAAAALLPARQAQMREVLTRAIANLRLSEADISDERLAQEALLIAVKADVTEEIDRLKAHIAAARDLIESEGPAGRKLDFLMQEFNREANTLCSKASYAPLTAVGLDLKLVIDQMREQALNVE